MPCDTDTEILTVYFFLHCDTVTVILIVYYLLGRCADLVADAESVAVFLPAVKNYSSKKASISA